MAPAWRRRRLRPGRAGKPAATVLLGIVGSLIGGFLGYVMFNEDLGEGAIQRSGIIGSIIGAIIALLIWRATGGRRYRALR